jgi:hypothetical protein
MTRPPPAQERPAPRQPPGRGGARPLILPLVVLAVLLVTATSFVTYVLWPRWPGPPPDPNAPALPIIVAGVTFNVPPAAIRAPVQRHAGTQDRIDLWFAWPSLEPPDGDAKPPLPVQGAVAMQSFERVFVTIAPGGNAIRPLERALTSTRAIPSPRRRPDPAGSRFSRSATARPTKARTSSMTGSLRVFWCGARAPWA